ncbi:MAG: asparagine synthase (glutamine-hydrolyzing) [Lachnospiraceae bacterium]|nr:asparagine synthase (glutamine-hydrolyzing) [Lachnospiraceae bacterium]
MCGIAGYISKRKLDASVIRGMTDALTHRGPDAEGSWADAESGVVLGHRRLSIRDLSANGAQPMPSHDGRFVMAYNGEIYNAAELKEASGETKWNGSSDTEILLEAFAALGVEKTLQLAKGMFAIALYDREKKTLLLMRDRIGEKPLYYGRIGGDFVFASEVGALAAFPGFDPEPDASVLPRYLLYGYIPAPYSIYKGIRKLMPGAILKITCPFGEGRQKMGRWYDLKKKAEEAKEHPFRGSFAEAADELERLLTESVRGQLASDVPLGAYLSGGVDSATVVALMSRLRPGDVRSFSIGFTEEKYNEAKEAAVIAECLGTKHTEQIVTEAELKEVIPGISGVYGEPFADSSQIPTYLVSKLARQQVTVSLSGDAGDELFCGYRTYPQIAGLWRGVRMVPHPLRDAAGKLLQGAGIPQIHRAGFCLRASNIRELKEAVWHYDPYIERLCGERVPIRHEVLAGDDAQQMLTDDILCYLPEDILVKVDRAGMAVSLENRIPMLDRDVLEFALSLPSEYKYDGRTQKKILKEVLGRYVPRELWERPKKGFAVPLERWLREGDTAEWAAELMEHSHAAADGLLRNGAVRGLWKDFVGTGRAPRLVWNVLMLEQWYRDQYEKNKDRGTGTRLSL